jgi:methylmalonyl-CoA mutase C-terminal domain/subunit
MTRKIRVLVGKPGLDGHDRGAKVVARAYRDAGMEVIYSGLHRTPNELVQAAIDEDVDVVALSILSGAHNVLVPAVIEGLRAQGAHDVLVLLGGIIPDHDAPGLYAAGVAGIFGPGTPLDAIVEYTRSHLPRTIV